MAAVFYPYTFQIVDQASGAQISAAKLFLNGSSDIPSEESPSRPYYRSGQSIMLRSGQTIAAQAKADGYQAVDSVYIQAAANAAPVKIQMKQLASATKKLTITTVPAAEEPVQCTLTPGPVVKDTVNGAVDFDVAAGDYVVSFSSTLYDADALAVRVEDASVSKDVLLRKKSDDGEGTGGDPADPEEVDLATSSILGQASAAVYLNRNVSEDIYKNSSYDKYYTSAQAKLFIGNLFIDELSSIQYRLHANSVPIYAYSSRDPDARGAGRCIVQGQIVINYVTDGYFYTVLDEYRRMFIDSAANTVQEQAKQLAQLMDAGEALAADLASNKINFNSGQQLREAIDAQVNALIQDPSAVRKARSQLRRGVSGLAYRNACYQEILFDMKLEIGDGDQKSVRMIEKAKLTSTEQIIANDNQVLFEIFGFEARRLR